jgi:hypothetical protein
MVRALAALAVIILFAGPAAAQSPSATLSLDGKVKQPRHWTFDDAKKLPVQHVEVTYQTEKGPVTASFTGVLMWSMIEAAGGIDDTGNGAALRHAISITATDGYVVVTSTGEIDPEAGDKGALVAYERDGKPLANFGVVMPGDKHGGRNVHDVTTITIE